MKENEYKWNGIKVVEDNCKGFKLFSTKFLQAGLLIPYGGVEISEKRAKRLESNAARCNRDGKRNNYADYIVVSRYGEENKPTIYLDGHQRNYPTNAPKNAWIGTFVCEPSSEDRANAELVYISDSAVPNYPLFDTRFPVFIELKCDINRGEEMLVIYHWSSRCYKRRGYQRGLEWDDPPRKRIRPSSKSSAGSRSEKQQRHSLTNIRMINELKRRR